MPTTTEQTSAESREKRHVTDYINSPRLSPLFLAGDSLVVLKEFPSNSIDCCVTSPPYWAKREYENGGLGLEHTYQDYINNLAAIISEVKRVLKPTGSLWLNMGDSYVNKGLIGIPWRVAFYLTDIQGWTLRNSVIWNKVKGAPDNSDDKLRNVHENVFHFVKSPKDYFYDIDAIRNQPNKSKVVKGSIVSATGVSGVKYKRQIELSTGLTESEKAAALEALTGMLTKLANGVISDFRMVIRNQQRTTHSNSIKLSGRAKELKEKGFYFLCYNPKGSKPSDVWEILPEDTQNRIAHFAPYPEDLCKLPILATCPPDGVVLDPFCGTGTTMIVASYMNKKSIGIDLSRQYIGVASERAMTLL